jgi:diguanylate cyclase (GGDEF)-like protein/PAS domain S-box-containing protein
MQPTLEMILDYALQLVAADDAHIFLCDGERLIFGAALWGGGHQQEPCAEPRPQGLTYTVARGGERIVVPDVSSHPLFQDYQWDGAIVGLPLRIGERVVGVMTVAFHRPHPFDESEMRVLGLLADQAAIAIENARLFEETEHLKAFNESVVEGVAEAILIEDARGILTFANPAAEGLTGYTREELVGAHWTTIVPEEEVEKVSRELAKRPHGIASDYDTALLRKTGEVIPVIVSARPLFEEGRFAGVLSAITDITARVRMEEALRAMALVDDLTGLYNRRGFFSLAEQQLKMTHRAKRKLLLLFADFDGLKQINDALGHPEGDRALVEVAEVFRETFRESDIVARIGGDEFVVLAVETNRAGPEALTSRLQEALKARNAGEGRRYRLALSVGVARYDPKRPCSMDELLARADRAMYEQKRSEAEWDKRLSCFMTRQPAGRK